MKILQEFIVHADIDEKITMNCPCGELHFQTTSTIAPLSELIEAASAHRKTCTQQLGIGM